MALRLTISSEQGPVLGDSASIVFGVGGGSIGRAHDNDWVLPDPQRYVSAHHARVLFRDGRYLLEDLSTNGVFVNDAAEPVRNHGPVPLRDGDVLRLGGYRITASIDDTGAAPQAEASAIVAFNTVPAGAADERQHPREGAMDLHELLVMERASSAGTRGRAPDAYGQLLPLEDTGLREVDLNQQHQEPITALDLRREASRPAATPAAPEAASAIEQFCRGAGIAPDVLPSGSQSRILFLGGLLLREALVGLKDLALAQQDMRTTLHIDAPSGDATERIPLRSVAVEDLLQKLLAGHDQHEIDAVQWLRDTIGGARRHDTAIAAALGAALAEFIPHLRPDPGSGPAVHARFRSITESPGGGLPHLYAEAFINAFLAAFDPGATPPPR
jgi:type VI secretion system protein